jgi:hypothetical protein
VGFGQAISNLGKHGVAFAEAMTILPILLKQRFLIPITLKPRLGS